MPFIGPRAVAQAHGVYLAAAEQSPTSLVSLIVLPEHGHEIDALEMVNRLTLDIIGQAGFGYDFGALSMSGSQLLDCWKEMMDGFRDKTLLALLMFTGVIGTRFPFVSVPVSNPTDVHAEISEAESHSPGKGCNVRH